jgi:hypothetical protein
LDELECLNRRHEAFKVLREGWELAKLKLGKSHKLTQSMKKVLEQNSNFASAGKFLQKNRRIQALQNRSNSSNPHSRVKFPQLNKGAVTPTREFYTNLRTVEKKRLRKVTVPSNQVSDLNDLVNELEETLEKKPRKYVFRQRREDIRIEENMHLRFDEDFPSTRKSPANMHDLTQNGYLQIIPESKNEEKFETFGKFMPYMKRVSRRNKGE